MRLALRVAAAAVPCLTLAAQTAHAYIDPGTGSMLLQIIGAGIAGAIFYFRELRIRLLSFFTRRQTRAPDDVTDAPPGDPPR